MYNINELTSIVREELAGLVGRYQCYVQGDSSFSIGGNFQATKSGSIVLKTDVRCNRMGRVLQAQVQVGNNLKDGVRGHAIAKFMLGVMEQRLRDKYYVVVAKKPGETLFEIYLGEKVVARMDYQYGRSWCSVDYWVM